jgi:hypothetical protein
MQRDPLPPGRWKPGHELEQAAAWVIEDLQVLPSSAEHLLLIHVEKTPCRLTDEDNPARRIRTERPHIELVQDQSEFISNALQLLILQ